MTVFPGVFGGVAGPIAVAQGTVLVPVDNFSTRLETQERAATAELRRGQLVALDLETGELRWQRSLPASLRGPVVISNDLGFATSSDGEVHAFELNSGDRVWSDPLPAPVEGGLAIAGNTLLVRAGIPAEGQPSELLAYRLGD
jgi:outer membrane protein assembly factor BamB